MSETPLCNHYCFDPKVMSLVLNVNRYLLKPRHQEQTNYIEVIEKRLLFEMNHIHEDFFLLNQETKESDPVTLKDRHHIIKQLTDILCDQINKDTQGLGIARKIVETNILKTFSGLLVNNTEEKSLIYDPVLTKYLALMGSICFSSPDQVSALLTKGLVQELLKSQESRIFMDKDAISYLLYFLSQASVNQEVQNLLLSGSSLFEKIVMCSVEGGVRSESFIEIREGRDRDSVRGNINSFLDRNPSFVEQTKGYLLQLLTLLKAMAIDFIKKSRILVRQRTSLGKEEFKKKIAELKNDPILTEKMPGGVSFLLQMVLNTQDRNQVANRNGQMIFKNEILMEILNLYDLLSEVPDNLASFSSGKLINILRSIVEQHHFQENLAEFMIRFRQSFDNLKNLFGNKLSKLRSLAELISTSQESKEQFETYAGENKEVFLSQLELFQTQLSQCAYYIKAFINLSTSTKLVLSSQYDFQPNIKLLFYLENAFNLDRAQFFGSQYS